MGGRCRERNIPVPCKRVRGYFVLGVGCFSKDYFSCGSCTISSARRSGLIGAPKVKRRLNYTTNQSSEERIVIVTLFRTLAFNGLLSVFCGGLPDSIGNGGSVLKCLGLRQEISQSVPIEKTERRNPCCRRIILWNDLRLGRKPTI